MSQDKLRELFLRKNASNKSSESNKDGVVGSRNKVKKDLSLSDLGLSSPSSGSNVLPCYARLSVIPSLCSRSAYRVYLRYKILLLLNYSKEGLFLSLEQYRYIGDIYISKLKDLELLCDKLGYDYGKGVYPLYILIQVFGIYQEQ